jgi:metallo-beta-lactamase family protein
MLPDAAHLQQEEAEFANKQGYSKHKPALPLYTLADALDAVRLARPIDYHQPLTLGGLSARFAPAGHLLGSASIEITADGRRVLFSGDLGRFNVEVTGDPERPPDVHAILIESTYGNRKHDGGNVEADLARIVNDTVRRRGIVLIPAFAVGRAQILLYYLRKLESRGTIPRLPVFIDSPMAVDATALYVKYQNDPNVKMDLQHDQGPLHPAETRFVRTRDESKAMNSRTDPCVIISSSGMATGGRVLHHLQRLLPEPQNTVLLVGYQAAGTRGRALQDGADSVKMFGERVPVRARVENIGAFSAHGDADDLARWLRSAPRPPTTVFLIHGEPDAQAALAERLRREIPSEIKIPAYQQTFEI